MEQDMTLGNIVL